MSLSLSQLIRYKRQLIGITQEHLGELVGRSRVQICYYEQGEKPISFLMFCKLVRVLKFSDKEILEAVRFQKRIARD